jgi:gliding motility-associated-like protein
MDQLLRNIISFFAPTAIVFLLLFSVQISAQNCMDVPADLNWTCIAEDDTFIYDNSEGVVITDCSGTISDLNPLVTISVDIEEDCPNTGFVRIYTRTFRSETGDPLDIDNDGNIGFLDAQQMIFVTDAIPPFFTDFSSELPDVVLSSDEELDEILLILPTFEDGCLSISTLTVDTTHIPSGICPENYLIERSFVIEDACGNTSSPMIQTITMVDTVPPYFTSFPDNLLLACGDDYPNDLTAYADSCDNNAFLSNYVLEFDFQPCASNTEITRTFTISDNVGNEASQTQYINFLDEDPPILLTPLDSLFYQCKCEVPDCMEAFDGLEFDDCSSGDVVPINCSDVVVMGDCEEHECVIERTYYFVDACGNEGSAKQHIEIKETLAPPIDSLFYQCLLKVPDCIELFEDLEFDYCSSGDVDTIECFDVVVMGDCEEDACVIERTYDFLDACSNPRSVKQYLVVQESVILTEIPTGITPNGDGYNDVYIIGGIGPSSNSQPGLCDWIENTTMKVINRWGSVVFEIKDYRNDWEGTNDNGEDLPQGTYFVVFESSGESFSTYLDIRR